MTQKDRESTVGFVGVGVMGKHMCTNILKKGRHLVGYDIVAAKVEELVPLGAVVASSPAEVARQAKTIVIMVDTRPQVESVLFGDDGIAKATQPGDKILCMSTIDPDSIKKFSAELAAKGVGMIDAPVSGMEEGARNGTLKAFVGGEASDLEACRPVLELMTSRIEHLGASGNGVTMKLVNNMMVQVGWVVISEALIMGTKAGLDPRKMVELISNASGNSGAFQYLAPRWLERNFIGTRLDVTFKDIQHEIDLAKSLGVPVFAAAVAQQVFQMARSAGLGSEDGMAVIKVYEQLAGVSPKT